MTMSIKKLVVVFLLLAVSSTVARAQRFSVGTNLVQWANYVTYNAELGYSLNRHISVVGGARFNDAQKDFPDRHVIQQNKQKTAYLGARYWPWYMNSGLWFGAKGQYQEFAQSGLWRSALDQGRAAGVGLSAGFTLMLTKHLNVEFGAGLWGGCLLEYTLYDCPICLNVRDRGSRMFIAPDDVSVSLVIVL